MHDVNMHDLFALRTPYSVVLSIILSNNTNVIVDLIDSILLNVILKCQIK